MDKIKKRALIRYREIGALVLYHHKRFMDFSKRGYFLASCDANHSRNWNFTRFHEVKLILFGKLRGMN